MAFVLFLAKSLQNLKWKQLRTLLLKTAQYPQDPSLLFREQAHLVHLF